MKIPYCDYCDSFLCTECSIDKDRENYPNHIYQRKCSMCANDEEGNQMWALGQDCVSECPDGTWDDEYECKECGWGCSECDDDEKCTSCRLGFVLT
jgi:hypothetical protein